MAIFKMKKSKSLRKMSSLTTKIPILRSTKMEVPCDKACLPVRHSYNSRMALRIFPIFSTKVEHSIVRGQTKPGLEM